MDIDYTLKTLSKTERQILYYYAIDGGEGQNIYRDKFIKTFAIGSTVFERTSRMLHDKGFVKSAGWYPRYYVISPFYRVGVLSYLFRNETFLEARYLEVFGSSKSIIGFFKIIRYSLTGTNPPPTSTRIEDVGSILVPYYSEPWIVRALEYVDDNSYLSFLENATLISAVDDTLILRDIVDRMFGAEGRQILVRQEALDYKTLYLYLGYGEYNVDKVPTTRQPLTVVTAGIRAALNGEYEAAVKLFGIAHKILNKTARFKNVFSDIFAQYYNVMSYVHLDDETSVTKLTQYVNKKDVGDYISQKPSMLMARTYLNSKRLPADNPLRWMISYGSDGTKYANLRHFGMLFDRYYGTGLYPGRLPMPSFAIMRHELSEYLDLTDDQRASLAGMYGTTPALTSIRLKKDWEVLIEDVLKTVDKTVPGLSVQTAATPSSRIVYVRAYGDHFEVKSQNMLKSGSWSKFKNVSLQRFYDGDVNFMDDTDRAIANIMQPKAYSYEYDKDQAKDFMPYLLGSDRVFDSSGEPIKVEPATAYIQVVKDQTRHGYRIDSNVTLSSLKSVVKGCVTVAASSASYHVIPLDENQRKIYERLLSTPYFPKESEPYLRKFLTRLDDVIDVKSPLLDQNAVETVNGAAVIAVKVTPMGASNYGIALCAKPLADGSTYCIPGVGKPVVYDVAASESVRVKRDLTGESAVYREVIDVIDTPDHPVNDGDYNHTLDISQLLDLLDYSRQNPDRVIIEWPQGKQVTLRTPLSKGSWNVGIKSDNGWFDLEGEVRLDADTVVKMSRLLEIISQERGRYVRLGDNDFVEIDRKLRRQLERLESIAVKNRSKMQISSLNAALLDDSVLNGQIVIGHDDKLTEMRNRILDSRNLNPKVPRKLKATLRPYQVDGYQWMSRLASWGAGACLADDMGLGKTVQTIAFLLDKATEGPALIVAPASVVPNWRNELERFAPSLRVEILNKAEDRAKTIKDMGKGSVLLTTYGLLNTEEEALTAKKWTTACLDEAHTIKNRETKMSQAAMKLSAKYRIALTGTPIQNHLGELWNLFRFINPGLLGPFDLFRQKFVIPISQDHDKERTRALQRIIKPFMLRRTKSEVIDDLPDKTDIVLPVELSDDEMAMYEAMRKKAVETLEEAKTLDVNTLAEITKLRRAACAISLIDDGWHGANSKVQTFLELVRDFKGDNNRMLVFSQFTSFLDIVRKALDDAGESYLYLDGSTSMKQREKLVEEFRQGDCPLFLISLKAGGLGLNLTEANYVVHLDPWWNPAIEQQATDRTYRIGQQRDVTVYHLVAKNTIEEKIRRLHQTKRDLSDSLLEGSDMAARLTVKDILEMLNEG